MEDKINLVEHLIQSYGLSLSQVVEHWVEQHKIGERIICKNIEPETVQLYDSVFSADDIRLRVSLFDYAFEGGKFSSDKDAYPNCQGVVGWINPDPNAREGDRVYVVLPEQVKLPYATVLGENVDVADELDGRENTKKLINNVIQSGDSAPAALYAFNYCNRGVKKGQAFLPASLQMEKIAVSGNAIRSALRQIGGTFKVPLWTSSMRDYGNATAKFIKSYGCCWEEISITSDLFVTCVISY